MIRNGRLRGRGFFNVVQKKEELAEARRIEELRIQQEVQEEKLSFLRETLNLSELIAFRNRWLKLGIRKDMNKHIKDLIGEDEALLQQKIGIDEHTIVRALEHTKLDVSKQERIDEIKQIKLQYDDVTYNRFKSCIKDELVKLHDAKNKIIDLISDNQELGISAHYDEVIKDIKNKLDLLTDEIHQLKEANKPEELISTRSTIGIFRPNDPSFPQFNDSSWSNDNQEEQTNKHQSTDEFKNDLKDFINNSPIIKQFINIGGTLKFDHASPQVHLCVIRNYQLIDKLTMIYPNLFHHFYDIIKLKFDPNDEWDYNKNFDNNYWFIKLMAEFTTLTHLPNEKSPPYRCGSYDLMFLDAIKETPIYDKIILVPSVRYCVDVKSYLYIDKLEGYKIPDNKNQAYYELKNKCTKIHYKPLIELDIINYYQWNELVCLKFKDDWYEYEEQKTFIGNYDYEYD